MARKVRKVDVEKNEKAIKKNRRRKATGRFFALVFVLFYLGIVAATTVFTYKVAEKAWDENIGNEAQVPFKDIFSIFNGVRKADENAIVTNAYGESDLTAFYDNVKRKMYLSQDYDLNIMKIISAVMGDGTDGAQSSQTLSSVQMRTEGTYGYDYVYIYTLADGSEIESNEPLTDEELGVTDSDSSGQEPIESTGNPAFDELLNELEFDFSSLADYNGGKNILEISDKQLAAFFSEMLNGMGEFFPQMSEIEGNIGASLDELFEIKQIIISGDALVPESVGLKITVNVKMRTMISALVKMYELPSIIASLMPENMFASVTVYPCDRTRGIQVAINKMSEVNVDKIVRIADVILQKTGMEMSISNMLIQVNSQIVDVIEKAQETIPLSFVATESGAGNMDLYPIETLMKMMNVQVSEQAFLYMLKDIKLPTASSLGYDVYTQDIKERDTQAFVVEVTSKYGIDNSQGQIGTQNTISDVLNFAQGDDLINKLNLNSIHHPDNYVEKEVRVGATYQALSNMLSSYVNEQGMLGTIQASIVNMFYPSNGVLAIDVEVNVSAMLGFDGNSAMSKLISQLIPESIFATAYIHPDDETPTTLEINKVSVENSKEHLNTLTSLATTFGMDVSVLSYDYICSQVDSGIKQGLEQIKEQLGYDIVFDTDKAYLPSLYELISGTSIVNGDLEEGEHYFTSQEIHKLLKHLYNYAFDESSNKFTIAENLDQFIQELYDKYFISQQYKSDLQKASEDNQLLDSLTSVGGDSFQMTNLRVEDLKSRNNITDVSSGDWEKINSQVAEQFNPVLSIQELAYLIGHYVDFEQALTFMKNVQIVFARNYSDYIEIVVRGEGNVTNMNATTLLPEYIYMDVQIYLGKTQADGSRSNMQVFSMDIHELSYNPQSNSQDIQDLQLLTMLIDRVNSRSNSSSSDGSQDGDGAQTPEQPENPDEQPTSASTTSLEKVVSDIELKLNGSDGSDGESEPVEGFKDKIHNNVFTVAFVDDGGFRLEQTIYQIALNAIYGDNANSATQNANKPSEIDFRNALCKSNNMPESVSVDGRVLSFASNKEEADRAIDELNEKYAFGESNKLDSGNMQGIFTAIGNSVSDYANAIDGEKLTSNYSDGSAKTVENLRPEIYEGELLNFLENSVTLTAEGYEDTQMNGLYITSNNKMTIIYMSNVKSVDSKYAELLPSKIAMLVNVNMALLKTDAECTQVLFNDLSDSEVAALEGVRNKITSPDSESQTSSLDSASKACSDSVKSTMQALTKNMDVTCSVKNGVGVMTLQSIYEIAAAKISESDGGQNAVKAQELKDTLEGLFAEFTMYGYTGESKDVSGLVNGKVVLGDGNISSKINVDTLKSNLQMSGSQSANALVLAQSAIVSAGDSALNDLRTYLGGRLSNSDDYFLLTYAMSTQAAIGASLSMLPNTMYITLYFDIKTQEIQMLYNNLSDSQANTLVRLINVNATTSFTDSSNLQSVKTQLLGTTVYGTYTLESLFAQGTCMPISNVTNAASSNVVGVGALALN